MARGGSIKNEGDDMRRDWRVPARVMAHEMIVSHQLSCTGRPKSPPEADRNRHPRPTEIAT